MLNALNDIKFYFTNYFNNGNILYFYLISLIVLCFCGKEKRKLIVYPSILIAFVIANPICYKLLWYKLIGGTYWRMIWMIPVLPTIACALISIIDIISDKVNENKYKNVIRLFVLFVFCCIVAATNTRLYTKGTHVEVHNMFKVPDSTVAVCNTLLEAEDGGEVKAIMPASMYCYTRQFDHRIHQMYGRDVEHYMAYNLLTEAEKKVAKEMLTEQPDMKFVTDEAKKNGYKYIVCEERNIIDVETMNSYGYDLLDTKHNYVIYRMK